MDLISKADTSLLPQYDPSQYSEHHLYVPGFKDECVFQNIKKDQIPRNSRIKNTISLSSNDYIVTTFKEGALSILGLKAKNVYFLGCHSNMCLMAVIMYLKKAKINSILIEDLVDSCWTYEAQKKTHPTHFLGNKATNEFFKKNYGKLIKSYEIINLLKYNRPKYPFKLINYLNLSINEYFFSKSYLNSIL